MPPRKELCRNFQRGSCQYGEQCRFLHVTQQPSKPNPFGFGMKTGNQFQHTNSQQQKPNPFGFGVQNSSQTRGANDFGSRQNQFKLFENKWTRASTNSGISSASRQSDNQPSAANHKCTDPASCKRQIIEDLEHERPLWKLTCYAHSRNGPCDIVGDTSYEELRLAAYYDAKNGMSFQSIIERERSLLNSKLLEFESLLGNPYTFQSNSTPATPIPFPMATSNVNSVSQNSDPPLLSSFSQLGASLNTGFGANSRVPPNNTFGQPNLFQNFSLASGASGMSNLPFGNAGSLGSQLPQPFGNSFVSSRVSLHNQTDMLLNGPKPDLIAAGHSNSNIEPLNSLPRKNETADDSIWKKEWKPGEIPEEAPPDEYIL